MRNRSLRAVPLVAWPMLIAGCQEPTERLNAPPQGSTAHPSLMQDNYAYMVDNGMMHDLCVSDVHFVPHTPQLSGLGVRRLNRYAEILEGYGGTVHLDTLEPKAELNQARIAAVNTYLASAGLNMNNVKVEAGLPQGRGMDAPNALRVLAEGTVDDTQSNGGSSKSNGAGAPAKKK